jgi:hypothetical protein
VTTPYLPLFREEVGCRVEPAAVAASVLDEAIRRGDWRTRRAEYLRDTGRRDELESEQLSTFLPRRRRK